MSDNSTHEYRVLIERPGLHDPSAYYHTKTRELAKLQMRQDENHYREWEPRTRVWIESRTVSNWKIEE